MSSCAGVLTFVDWSSSQCLPSVKKKGLFVCTLPAGLGRFALLVPIIACFGMLVGRGVVMGSLLVLRRVPLPPFGQPFAAFHNPPRSSGALLAGTLPLQYCSAKFASGIPFRALPVPGHVAGLVADEVRAGQVRMVEVVGRGVEFVGVFGSGRKRCRQNRENPAHLRGTLSACSSTCVEEVAFFWVHWCL